MAAGAARQRLRSGERVYAPVQQIEPALASAERYAACAPAPAARNPYERDWRVFATSLKAGSPGG